MSEHQQITIIKDRDTNMSFKEWINYLKLRFQTRQWRSSLDHNSYVVHRSQCGTANGITVEFPFSLGRDTFIKRMGAGAMDTIHLFWYNSPHFTWIDCPDFDGLPEETYWVLIIDQNFCWCFDSWVDLIQEYFDDNNWQHNVNSGHETIYDKCDSPIGIYVTMPYPMTFTKFLDRMQGRLNTIKYVTKTTHDMHINDLSLCHSYGFFDAMDDGELY